MKLPSTQTVKSILVPFGLFASVIFFYAVFKPEQLKYVGSRSSQKDDDKNSLEELKLQGTGHTDNTIIASNLHENVVREGRDYRNGKWESFTDQVGFECYAYTAFYDDRRSLASLPIIRIIVVAAEVPNFHLICHVDLGQSFKDEYMEVERCDIGAGVTRHNTNFKEYIYSCKLNHEVVPNTVGLVTKIGDKSRVTLPIELPEKPQTRINFGMCISVSFWRHDPHQLVEWFELLKILGVGQVTVYNNSLEHESVRVFEHYRQLGFLEFRQSHNFIPDPGELSIHLHMAPVINDCMYRNMYKYAKIVVTDLDELVIPRGVDNYNELLPDIANRMGLVENRPTRHYIFRNNYFFLDTPGEDVSQSPFLVTMRHRKKVVVSEPGYAIKSIIDPLACVAMHNHYCWEPTGLYRHALNTIEVDPKIALSHHYKKCHLDIWEYPGRCKELIDAAVIDDIMLRYKERLEERVKPHLKRLGLPSL